MKNCVLLTVLFVAGGCVDVHLLDSLRGGIYNGNVEWVREVLDEAPSLANSRLYRRITPLSWAVCNTKPPPRRLAAMKAAGADMSDFDEEHGTSSPEIVAMLLKVGADPNIYCYSETPIHDAALRNLVEVGSLLASHGADLNAVTLSTSSTLGSVKESSVRETALHVAARHGHDEFVAMLLAGGADPTVSDGTGALPFLTAVFSENKSTATKLLRAALKVKGDDDLESLLLDAAKSSNESIAVQARWALIADLLLPAFGKLTETLPLGERPVPDRTAERQRRAYGRAVVLAMSVLPLNIRGRLKYLEEGLDTLRGTKYEARLKKAIAEQQDILSQCRQRLKLKLPDPAGDAVTGAKTQGVAATYHSAGSPAIPR